MFGMECYSNYQILIYHHVVRLSTPTLVIDTVTSFGLFLVKTSGAEVKNIVMILPEV